VASKTGYFRIGHHPPRISKRNLIVQILLRHERL
jgi:hypothetical protein